MSSASASSRMNVSRLLSGSGFGIGSSLYKPGESAAVVAERAKILVATLHGG
jgi:hypothetical protein